MEPFKYNAIAHAELDFLAPVSSERMDRVIDLLELRPGSRVLDLACGKGELLVRTCARWGATGDGLEPSPTFRAGARAEAAARLDPGAVALHEVEAFEFEVEPETYDLVIAMNTRPFGDFQETLRQAWIMVRSGGMALIGEKFWRGEPEIDYLDILGAGPDTFSTHAGNVALAVAEGFTPMYTTAVTQDELDHYEGMCSLSVERFLRANPGDAHAGAFREHVRRWRDAYLRWGRDSVGFGIYVLLK